MVTGFASAATTALIGLGSYFPDAANMFYVPALLVSASLTIVTAWDNLYKHNDLWIMNVKATQRTSDSGSTPALSHLPAAYRYPCLALRRFFTGTLPGYDIAYLFVDGIAERIRPLREARAGAGRLGGWHGIIPIQHELATKTSRLA